MSKALNVKTVVLIVVALAALVACLIATGVVKLPFNRDPVENQIEQFVAAAAEHLPIQVNDFTRWDRIEKAPGKAFVYVYTLTKDLTDEEKQAMRERVTAQALAVADLQAAFDAGVTVWYKYYDPAGKEVLAFPVKK